MFISELIAATVTEETPASNSIWDLVWDAGPVVKLVLLILAIFSIISWAIIIFKHFYYKKSKKLGKEYLKKFYDCENLDAMYTLSKKYQQTPIASVFIASYKEMQKLAKKHSDFKADIENIERAINKAHTSQLSKLEEFIPFLATTASATPFIGLFGTVWGIMNSFHAIGTSGSANLATVAPGISEALIATALGLAAAIPAVVFYNFFLNKIKKLNYDMKNFKADLLNIIKRNF